MFNILRKSTEIPTAEAALKGRDTPIPTAKQHYVLDVPLKDVPAGHEQAMFGMGCFWGVERMFWKLDGVHTTAVGYAGGHTPNATYEEVCSGKTGHNEVVHVVYDPKRISYEDLLKVFWEGHDPTQGMRQGNDRGTQYRSGIYVYDDAQRRAAEATREAMQPKFRDAGYGQITTEIVDAPTFYYAEEYHQQYLAKNPNGYCGIGGTGVTCPIGVAVA
ncbi:Peptide methionine sulfoxide reductase MsrA [Rhodobacteraceae bacterium THAF1]|uniref:peptide-methionine (S)-S-oxide reductase MsrA n=1 Tax=Palleronia sp. THAF1 TaxID=2587842 RepID=UPI000F3E1D01|nr:peptide-methionine (S)-S-oxide reductase MsrA [Palleronia sp. THAF1]QFU07374.1 Peptide methionine sulfoxide reductase MsrA [Palleronia sp. THAF1]VDC20714.1 Peptide methionine sulfoxide reductase MsrA [Rhodobacteraceae bacterium THAF1]